MNYQEQLENIKHNPRSIISIDKSLINPILAAEALERDYTVALYIPDNILEHLKILIIDMLIKNDDMYKYVPKTYVIEAMRVSDTYKNKMIKVEL